MAYKNSIQLQPSAVAIPFKRMLRRKTVELKTGFSCSTIYRLMRLGQFPQCYNVGIRAVAWDEQEIDAWMSQRKNQQ